MLTQSVIKSGKVYTKYIGENTYFTISPNTQGWKEGYYKDKVFMHAPNGDSEGFMASIHSDIAAALEGPAGMHIEQRVAAQLLSFAAQYDVRYQLCGVHVGKEWLEATDGHRGLRVRHEAFVDKPVIIPRDAFKIVAKKGITIRIAAGRYCLCAGDTVLFGNGIRQAFPDMGRVIPKDRVGEIHIGEALAKAKSKKKICVVRFNEEGKGYATLNDNVGEVAVDVTVTVTAPIQTGFDMDLIRDLQPGTYALAEDGVLFDRGAQRQIVVMPIRG